MTNAITALLQEYPSDVATLAGELRHFLLEALPDATEQVDQSAHLISFGHGPGYKDTLFLILLSKNQVKLGFYRGSELPDPHHLLTGSGKVHKYVVINSSADIQSSPLKQLIDVQIARSKQR